MGLFDVELRWFRILVWLIVLVGLKMVVVWVVLFIVFS